MMPIMNTTVNEHTITNTNSLFGALLNDRIIMVNSVIDENLAATVIAQMLYLDALGNSPIQMYINSPGGIVQSAGLGIFDCMNHVKSKIITICIAQASSMGAFLLSAGQESYALPNSRIMIHAVSGAVQGQFTDIQIQASEIQKTNDKLNKILAKNTGKTVEEIKKDTERDYFMSAEEAVEYGIIDAVLYPPKKV